MRAVIQRVSEASVTIAGETVSAIGPGLLVLIGVENHDDSSDVEWLASKISGMRIFADADERMNLSLMDRHEASMIVVSQFTLHASTRKGNRPSFIRAAAPEQSEPLYEAFCDRISGILGRSVGRGRFGADMKVALINDGPVTIVIDSRARE